MNKKLFGVCEIVIGAAMAIVGVRGLFNTLMCDTYEGFEDGYFDDDFDDDFDDYFADEEEEN